MTKEELQNIRNFKIYLDTKKQEIEMLKNDLTYIKGIDYTKDKTGQSQITQEDLICSISDKETELMKDYKILLEKQQSIKEKIFKIQEYKYQAILYQRYILCNSWEDIADDLGYTRRHTTRLHGEALQKIKDVL